MPFAIPFPDISPEVFSISPSASTSRCSWYALAYIAGIVIGWRLAVRALRTPRLWAGDTPPMTPGPARGADDLGHRRHPRRRPARLRAALPASLLPGEPGADPRPSGRAACRSTAALPASSWRPGLFARRHGLPRGLDRRPPGAGDAAGADARPARQLRQCRALGAADRLPWGVVFPGEAAQDCPGVDGALRPPPEPALRGRARGAGPRPRSCSGSPGGATGCRRPWRLFGAFLAGYGAARFLVEFVRQPDAQFVGPGNPLGYALAARAPAA